MSFFGFFAFFSFCFIFVFSLGYRFLLLVFKWIVYFVLWCEMIFEVDELVKADYEVAWMKKAILVWFGMLFVSGIFVLYSLSFAPLFVVIAVPGFFSTIFVGSIIGGYIFFRERKSLSRAKALKEALKTLF